MTGLEGQVVVTGESEGDRVEGETLRAGPTELAHAVGPPDAGHPADGLEEAHQALEGVGLVDGRGEPPGGPRPGGARIQLQTASFSEAERRRDIS